VTAPLPSEPDADEAIRSLLRVTDVEGYAGMPTDNALISVVVPIFNEDAIVDELHRRLTAVLTPLGRYEIVLVDDGSSDETWRKARDLARTDPHLRLVRLSRNFGHQIALSAGLEHARGDAVVSIDGDLQDPPELIPQLVDRWREGSDVVFAIR
jgi:polyisoprenyl-phosphate glycosyltransferase